MFTKELGTVEENLNKMSGSGFDPVEHFLLPGEDWQNYFGPLQEQVIAFRSSHAENRAAHALADSLHKEIAVCQGCGESFGDCFFVGRAD